MSNDPPDALSWGERALCATVTLVLVSAILIFSWMATKTFAEIILLLQEMSGL